MQTNSSICFYFTEEYGGNHETEAMRLGLKAVGTQNHGPVPVFCCRIDHYPIVSFW